MKTAQVDDVTVDQANAIIRRDLQPVIDRLIREAHKQGSKGKPAYAEYSFVGKPLFNAVVQLGNAEFEGLVRACLPGDIWAVSFGRSVRLHAISMIMLRLK